MVALILNYHIVISYGQPGILVPYLPHTWGIGRVVADVTGMKGLFHSSAAYTWRVSS